MSDNGLFDKDACTYCGECFTRCRYMDISRQEAISEIKNLADGKPTKHVLDKCISCYACNAFCPEDANPYQLILSKWNERYREKGLPVRASYLMPHCEPDYRMDLVRDMPQKEKDMLAKWRSTPSEGEVLYPGCNLLANPFLFDLKIFDQLPVSGDWSLCCGEPYYRSGMFDVMQKIADGLEEYYKDKKIDKMVFICPACMNMFKNVFPKQFGVKFDFECEYLTNWLLQKMDDGELEITKPLDMSVALHDSCHSRVMKEEDIMNVNREFLKRLGVDVINTKNHHEEGLCCGVAAGCRRQMPHDIMIASYRQVRECKSTGADEMGIYCTGCYLMLNLTRNVFKSGQKMRHTLEYLAEATGDPKPYLVEKRTKKMLNNVIIKAVPTMLSPKRYFVEKINIGEGMETKENKKSK